VRVDVPVTISVTVIESLTVLVAKGLIDTLLDSERLLEDVILWVPVDVVRALPVAIEQAVDEGVALVVLEEDTEEVCVALWV